MCYHIPSISVISLPVNCYPMEVYNFLEYEGEREIMNHTINACPQTSLQPAPSNSTSTTVHALHLCCYKSNRKATSTMGHHPNIYIFIYISEMRNSPWLMISSNMASKQERPVSAALSSQVDWQPAMWYQKEINVYSLVQKNIIGLDGQVYHHDNFKGGNKKFFFYPIRFILILK